MRVRFFAAVVALAAMVGCATTERFEALMSSWLGHSEAELVSKLGPPNNSYRLQDGGRVLSYSSGATVPIGGGTTYTPMITRTTGMIGSTPVYGTSTTMLPTQMPIYNVPLYCTVNFTINDAGRVTYWQATGNHCVAR